MSMRDNNHMLTICEVLRCANDCLQGGITNEPDKAGLRDLLALAEHMAKRMAGKLRQYKDNFDADWWVEKKTHSPETFKRELETYQIGDPENARKVLEAWTI